MCGNNWVKDNRSIIRQKFWFRVVALVVSAGIIIAGAYDTNKAMVGVAISVLAWALVELYNYAVDVNSKYIVERVFFLMD